MTAQTVELEERNLRAAPHILRNVGCVTCAKLDCVRRIRLSVGGAGRSRSSRHVSGLLFEYYNSERNSIVGQWFEEIDSVDLDNGDFVVHIRVWYTQETDVRNYRGENNGKVVGIMLSTFRGIHKQVLLEDSEDLLYLDYYANPLEEMVSFLLARLPTFKFLRELTAHLSPASRGVSTMPLITSRFFGDRRCH